MPILSYTKELFLRVVFMLRGAFWAIPAALLSLAAALAFFTLWLDINFPENLSIWRLDVGLAQGIETTLSTTAAAILGVAGVSFSVTIASLTLASQQFGPRLIRNFIEDRFTQTVLGFFVATFLFCILSMQLSGALVDHANHTPTYTLIVTLVLTIVDLLLLVLFIHHICVSIQADSVIAGVFSELRQCIKVLLPEDGKTTEPSRTLVREIDNGLPVQALEDGYLQHIDIPSLVEYSEKHDLKIKFEHRAGDYLLSRSVLSYVGGSNIPPNCEKMINDFVVTGYARSPRQDLEYCVRQLVEIALRALSPSVNDPFTAMTCIDRLGTALSDIANRPMPSSEHVDSAGVARVLVEFPDYKGLVDASFNQIRQAADGHIDVTIRLLEIICLVISQTRTSQQADALQHQANLIYSACTDSNIQSPDKKAIEERYLKINDAIESLYEAR